MFHVRFTIQSRNVEQVRFYYGEYDPKSAWIEYVQVEGLAQVMHMFIPIAPGLQIDVIPKVSSDPYELTLKVLEYAGDYDSALMQQIRYLNPFP